MFLLIILFIDLMSISLTNTQILRLYCAQVYINCCTPILISSCIKNALVIDVFKGEKLSTMFFDLFSPFLILSSTYLFIHFVVYYFVNDHSGLAFLSFHR